MFGVIYAPTLGANADANTGPRPGLAGHGSGRRRHEPTEQGARERAWTAVDDPVA
jgi:hypothetical protein